MARSVDHLKVSVAEVDFIAVGKGTGCRSALHAILGGAIWGGRQRRENVIGNVGIGESVGARRAGEQLRFGGMNPPLGKLVVSADVVKMRVTRHGQAALLGDERHVPAK